MGALLNSINRPDEVPEKWADGAVIVASIKKENVRLLAEIERLKQVNRDLADDFTDYVCSGSNSPAPYCKNRCDACCPNLEDWCDPGSQVCEGFRPIAYHANDGATEPDLHSTK